MEPIVLDNVLDRRDQIALIRWPGQLSATLAPSMVHHVDLDDKRHIFRRIAPVLQSKKERAEQVIRNLQTLYPLLLEDFEAKFDQIDDFTLRLVHPQREVPDTSYLAVSYCWSDQAHEGLGSELLGAGNLRIPVSPAMFQSAIGERISPNEGLWIDQICIDQMSMEEKSVAIPTMDTVYRNATRVVVCLEDVVLDEQELVCLFGVVKPAFEDASVAAGNFPHLNDQPPYILTQPALLRLYMKICDSRWFRRAWCSHEMRLSRWHRFYVNCVPGIFEGEEATVGFTGIFLWWLAALTVSIPALSDTMRRTTRIILKTLRIAQMMRQSITFIEGGYASESTDNVYTITMLDAFQLGAGGNPFLPSEDLRSSDANRDRVSIVLNLIGDGLRLKYNPANSALEKFRHKEDCYRKLLVLAIAAGDPVTLCITGNVLCDGDGTRPHLTSWIMMPSESDLGSEPEHHKLPAMDISSIKLDQGPEMSWIEADGFRPCKAVEASEVSIRMAVMLLEDAERLGLGLSPEGNIIDSWGVGPDYSAWQCHFIRPGRYNQFMKTLAIVLHLGTEWLVSTADSHGFPTRYKENLSQAASGFSLDFTAIESRLWTRSIEGVKCVDATLRFVNWIFSWGQINSHSAAEENWGPCMYETDTSIVLTFVPDQSVHTTDILIPLCLSQVSYAKLARVWVTETVHSDNEEHKLILRGKTRVFSPHALASTSLTAGGWTFVKDQRIHGP